ncbi:hypothetical protein SAMN04487761_1724 [Lachnospiraceae bacterium C7]|nr:hypothetical protein SAMN04487761_1724 [Lachnospiraceae bacterium C7]
MHARKSNKYKNKPVTLITGASSGIGREFAYQLSKKGYNLVLVARRKERLIEVKRNIGTSAVIVEADITNDNDLIRIFKKINGMTIDVFINNAGFGLSGSFETSDLTRELDMIDLNIKSMHKLTKVILKKMEAQGHGKILNVASSAGLFPAGPYMATYYATKAYVASLTMAIAEELRQKKSPIYIGCLCPGPVNTEFNDVANVKFALKGISPKRCVKYTLKKMKKNKIVIVPTLQLKLAIWGSKFMPRKMLLPLVASQQKKKMG